GTVRLLKEADRVNAPLHDIQPEKTLTGAVKGVTVDQVEQLKKMALRSVTDRHKVQELTEENTRLRSQVPSMKKRLEEAQRQQRLEQENRRLRDENYYLQSELQEERSFTERLTDGIGRMLDFLEEHLPERLRPLLEKARELLPDPEIGQQQEQQQHQRGMGGMEL
ncbi:plasmid recombination enzyme, partial [Lawsonibacter sp. NSJ-52]|nr:plasmid recombination enzyme [Lawsonibacter faecis]